MAPTSTPARPTSFRPEVEIDERVTRVLTEQAATDDPTRLGEHVGRLTFAEVRTVDAALRLMRDL